jgi:hypothetical protein
MLERKSIKLAVTILCTKQLVHEGNIRRIIIKTGSGKPLLEFPLTVGVVGAVLLPVWAALGAAAALITDCTIVVEKVEK